MKTKKTLCSFILAGGDIVLMYLSILLALAIRGSDFSFLPGDQTRLYLLHFSFLHPMWLFTLFLLDFYEIHLLKGIFEFISNLIIFLIVALITGAFYFYFQWTEVITPKTILFMDVGILGILISLSRFFFNLLLNLVNYRERIMVIGSQLKLMEISPSIIERNRYSLLTCSSAEMLDYNFLVRKIEKKKPSSIVLALEYDERKNVLKEIFPLLPLGFNYISYMTFYENSLRKISLDLIDEMWFLENLRKRGKIYNLSKRAFDIVFSLIGLVMTACVFPGVALLIKIVSPGPVIFKQERVGKNEQIFNLYKFRTMQPKAEEENPSWEVEKDSRLIPFGTILRLTHLDELPQFYNILKGDISFVGPRPEWLEFVKVYRENVPFYDIRHMIKPGLTGWAQLNWHNGASLEEVKEKLKYDFYYVKHHTLVLDLGIIFKTISNILKTTWKDALENKKKGYHSNCLFRFRRRVPRRSHG